MKIVQSFWSGNQKEFSNNYGWHSAKHNWISWILSCHQLVKFHKDVELYTDEYGYDILINKLSLPYTKVHVVLDQLNNYNQNLWAIGKIKTFALQNDPFIHVDGDVFVWESLTQKFQNSNLITQNLEKTTEYYKENWEIIYPQLDYIPDEMENYHNGTNHFACNMGIIGGNNIEFIKGFAKKSIAFVNKNNVNWNDKDAINFNIFFEQVFFYQLANIEKQVIDFQFKEVTPDNDYKGFADFDRIPVKTYLHLLGSYKRNEIACKAMEIYVMRHFPVYYSKLMSLINEENNNNQEIEFLTPGKVTELISEFESELRNNKINEEYFLLKRDLFNEGLPNEFDKYRIQNLNFTIVKLQGFVVNSKIIDNERISFFDITEINQSNRLYAIDEIDEIILSEMSNPILYDVFMKNMENYFEEEDEDAKDDFLFLINQRLRNYIKLKIITIYT